MMGGIIGAVAGFLVQLFTIAFLFGKMFQKQKDMAADIEFIKRHVFNGKERNDGREV